MKKNTKDESSTEVVVSRDVLEAELAAAWDYLKARHAPGTRRVYQGHWDRFAGWCAERGLTAAPAAAATVAVWLAAEADRGQKPATLTTGLAAIGYVHAAAGWPLPGADPRVKAVLSGIRRSVGTAPVRKAPATVEVLAEMLANAPASSVRGLRDRALLLVGFAGAFRRAELAGIRLTDVEEVDEGLKIRLARSKGDQEAQGQVVAIPRGECLCPVQALTRWVEVADIRGRQGYLFRRVFRGGSVPEVVRVTDRQTGQPVEVANRLTAAAVGQIVKGYAGLAGYQSGEFAGHSLRAGFLTSAARRGATVFKLMEHSRHKSVQSVAGYVRATQAFEDHPGQGLL